LNDKGLIVDSSHFHLYEKWKKSFLNKAKEKYKINPRVIQEFIKNSVQFLKKDNPKGQKKKLLYILSNLYFYNISSSTNHIELLESITPENNSHYFRIVIHNYVMLCITCFVN